MPLGTVRSVTSNTEVQGVTHNGMSLIRNGSCIGFNFKSDAELSRLLDIIPNTNNVIDYNPISTMDITCSENTDDNDVEKRVIIIDE